MLTDFTGGKAISIMTLVFSKAPGWFHFQGFPLGQFSNVVSRQLP